MFSHSLGNVTRSFQLFRSLAVLLILTVVLGACQPAPAAAPAATDAPAGATSAPAGATSAPAATDAPAPAAMDQVGLRLSWRWKAEFAALALADDKGFFEEQNIDVELLEGKSSGDAVTGIANKTDDFAYLNLTTVTIGIGKELPITVVAGLMGKHPSALAYFEETGIEEPKDLEGKTIALSPGEAFAVIWPAFAQKWEIDTNQVTTVALDATAKNQAFLEGKVDVLPLYLNNELPQLRTQTDKTINVLVPAEWGFNTLANGLITNSDTVANNPDLVRRMVAAISKGYAYAMEHPDEAVDAVLKRSSELASQPREVIEEQVALTLDLVYSEGSQGHPIGWMAEDDWNRTLDLLAETGATPTRLANDAVYTNAFVPETQP